MESSNDRPWRRLSGVEGREARLTEVGRLADSGLDAAAISAEMEVAQWVVERDLAALAERAGQ